MNKEIVREKLPNGETIERITGNDERYYCVINPNGSQKTFELAPDITVDRLYSTTTITKFPDKSEPLMWWAAREAANHFTKAVYEHVPRTIAQRPMDSAKPHTMMLMAARDWMVAGEPRAAVADKVAELNQGYREPLSTENLDMMMSHAALAAEHALRNLEAQLNAISREARRAHKVEKDRTSNLGTRVHEWVENDMKGIALPIREDMERPIAAYRRWRQTSGIVGIVALEKMLYHPAGFAGTADAVLRLEGGAVAVVDFKTSARIYESHLLQIGAYARAWEHVHGDPVNTGWAVRLGREDGHTPGGLEPVRVEIVPAWNAFSSLIVPYHLNSTIDRDARAA